MGAAPFRLASRRRLDCPAMRPARFLCTVTLAATLALAACGGGDDDSGASDGEPVATVKLEQTEYRFDPAVPKVEGVGVVKIEVTNSGKIGHALEVVGPEREFEVEAIAPGETATLEADLGEPGFYKWYCPIADHDDRGMIGAISVGGGGGEEEE